MGRDLLVAHVDDLDAFVKAAVVDVDDMAAAQGEDGLDALVFERLGNQVAARNFLLASVPTLCAAPAEEPSENPLEGLLAAPAMFILLHGHFHFITFHYRTERSFNRTQPHGERAHWYAHSSD